jgi:hypothetical protein
LTGHPQLLPFDGVIVRRRSPSKHLKIIRSVVFQNGDSLIRSPFAADQQVQKAADQHLLAPQKSGLGGAALSCSRGWSDSSVGSSKMTALNHARLGRPANQIAVPKPF